MATLIFSALGTVLGGPLGGVFGAVAGQAVDSAIIGGSGIQGPRLKDLSVTTSVYGSSLPRHFGKMRVGGTIIWATDLVEHSQSSGGGKGRPSVTTYSYTSSFAVALSSRPIIDIGRIWADGNLLRGAAGDLKVGGSIRIHSGQLDQPVDPLIAANEGAANCPAFRGIAYVVFEDLQLADYGNRIPNLSFEVIADSGQLSLEQLFDGVVDGVDANVALPGIAGFSSEGSFDSTVSQFQQVFPMDCDAGGQQLTIARQRFQTSPIMLSEPATSSSKADFGAHTGFARKRVQTTATPPQVIRYYDLGLDYQAGSQRAPGQAATGQPGTVELPATLAASDAFHLIAKAARGSNWARETMSWRSADLDPDVAPGAIVILPGQSGQWRVTDWEWRETGVELMLERLSPGDTVAGSGDAGRANLAADVVIGPTSLTAFELPWDGTGGGDTPAIFAAASSASTGWSGAALYVDDGRGDLTQIGAANRQRATIGTVANALPSASPLLIDRQSSLLVQLLGTDMALAGCSIEQLANGANKALVGSELIQFCNTQALGNGLWRIDTLARGRGGTEAAILHHSAGEAFSLVDSIPTQLDSSRIGTDPAIRIGAIGLTDPAPVEAAIMCRGISTQPLFPVQPAVQTNGDGSLTLAWTRRARGAWQWLDGVDVPLQEESEGYLVEFGTSGSASSSWQVTQPTLTISAATLSGLRAQTPSGSFWVSQQGTFARSMPLLLAALT